MSESEILSTLQFPDKTYEMGPTAYAVHNDKALVKAVSGPAGSGKSTIGTIEFYNLCFHSKVPIRGCVVRESYRQLQDSTRHTFMEWLGPWAVYNKGNNVARLTIPGADGITRTHELYFRPCRRDEEAANFLSTEYSFIWFEEPVPAFLDPNRKVMGGGLSEKVFQFAFMRALRQGGTPWKEFFLSFNPPSTRHWCYTTFYKPKSERIQKNMESGKFKLWRMGREENERHLQEGYYDLLLDVLSDDLARRYVHGDVVSMYPGEAVYKETTEGWHITEKIPAIKGHPLIIGFDFGSTPCALITQVISTKGGQQWRWLRELQLWNASLENLLEELTYLLKTEYKGFSTVCWGDPTPLRTPSEIDARTPETVLEAYGYKTRGGIQDWFTRCESMKKRLSRAVDGKPALVISEAGCPLATEGMLGGYRYPNSDHGLMLGRPVKNEFSHLINAAEYIATREFQADMMTSRHQQPAPTAEDDFEQWKQRTRQRGQWKPLESPVLVVPGVNGMTV
jgi:hypothetical protein